MEKVQKAALSKEGGIGRTQTFDWENDWSGRVGGYKGHDKPKNEAEEGKRRLHDRRKS